MLDTKGLRVWEQIASHPADTLAGLRADALDCTQTSIAVLADLAHGAGTHLSLAAKWRFPSSSGRARGLQPTVRDRLDEADELVGLGFGESAGPLSPHQIRRLAADEPGLLVVADSHYLPWLPMAGHQHMAHGFLLLFRPFGCLVVDAYHNDTKWGPARPGVWNLTDTELATAIRHGATAITLDLIAPKPQLDPAAMLAHNALSARAALPAVERYARSMRSQWGQDEAVEQLVLDIWLVGRERSLFTTWLGDHQAAASMAARATQWQDLAAASYLAVRRRSRGAPFDPTTLDELVRLFHADAALLAELADTTGATQLRGIVLESLRQTLEVDDQTINTAGALRDLPGFSSFRLVEVIDRVERRLGRSAIELTPRNLRDVDGLCRLFTPAVPPRSGPR